MKQKLFKTMLLLCALIVGSGTAWAEEVTYTFTNKSWAASPANWTSGQDGAGFSNNGIQVTTAATGANGTSPVSFTNVTKIVATYNTNKSKGAGTIEAKIGENDAVSKNWAYSGSADGTSSYFTVQWDYETPQSGYVNIKCNTTTNSIYLVSVTITAAGGGGSTTYTVTYDANGGSGTMTDTNSPYASGASVTVLGNTFTREGYTFSKWNTAANGSGTDYSAGNTFTINANTTLYAQWTANGGGTGGNTVTLTQSNLELTGSYTTDTEKTIDGITYVFTDLMKNNENIQAKASTGTIKNTTPYPSDITSVVITHSGTARETTIYGSVDGTNWTQVATGSGSINADFSSKGYKYFQITRGSNAAYWTKIEITYSSAKEETFSYVDYQGWANSPDYGKEITMSKTDVNITNNYFYTPQGDYHYIRFTATNGDGTVTITPKNGATITQVRINALLDGEGIGNGGTINASTGTVSKNPEGTVITWEGEATSAFTLEYSSHIYWTSIVVTYTGGLPTCATPVISGETTFLTYSTVSITCATEGASIYYSTSTDGVNYTDYESYSEPFQISTTTQVRAYATKDGLANSKVAYQAFSQQGTVPNIRTFASTGAASQYLELHDALVTYKNGNTAYMEDAYGAIMLYSCVGDDLEAGDKLNGYMHVTGFTPSYNGLPEITDYELVEGYTKTSGNTVTPTVVTIAQLTAGDDADPYESYLSKYIKIENATVTSAFASKNCTISDGTNEIILRDNGSASLTSTVNDVVTVTGHVSIYNSTKQIAVYEQSQIEVSISSDPTIIASATSLTGFTYAQGNGPSEIQSFTLSGFNLTDDITLSVVGDYEASTTEDSGFGSSIVFSKDATNQTVYVRLKAGLAENASYEGTITLASEGATNKTITLAGSVTAPEPAHFVWDLSTDETTTATAEEMTWVNTIATMAVTKGKSSTPTNNYYPGSGSYTSTRFYNGSNFSITPAAGYAITSVVFTATTTGYASAFQRIEWINATASLDGTTVTVTPTEGNTAISATIGATCGFTSVKVYYETVASVPSITVDPATVGATAAETEGTLDITYANLPISDMNDFDIQYYDAEGNEIAEPAEPAWIDVLVAEQDPKIGEGYVVSYYMIENDGAARTAYFKVYAMDAETNLVYSNLVTVTQAAYVAPATLGNWVAASLADINANDVFVIVGNNGDDYAMTNDNGTSSAPSVVAVTVVSNTLSGVIDDNIKWNLSGNATDGYTFYPNGETETWLYCTNTNNGVRVGTGDAKHFTLSGNYLTTTETTDQRYLGIYNSQDWRCYTNTTGNIAGQTFTFYKQLAVKLNGSGYATFSSTVPIDFSDDSEFTAWAITEISGTTISFSQITGAVPANTGVLLKGTANTTVYPVTAISGTAPTSNLLTAISTATTVTAGQYYGLSGDKFVKVGAGTVPAGKALLPASAVGSSIKAFNFVFEDDPDGINSIDNGELTIDNAAIYNLAGQRLSKMQKGINIVNGKKILK